MLLSELTSNFEGYGTYSTDIWKGEDGLTRTADTRTS